ncbi:MAG: dihydrofolate reductase, partial [Bacteroidota bacterium]
NRVIGKDNDLPWHLPDDFQFFKDMTRDRHVIMGRKNFESLPHRFRPLPLRTNVVITRQKDYEVPKGVFVVPTLEKALDLARLNGEEEAFIIGGGQIYALGLEHATTIYLTEIQAIIEGDIQFPEFDPKIWHEVQRRKHPSDAKHLHSFDFVTYEKV